MTTFGEMYSAAIIFGAFGETLIYTVASTGVSTNLTGRFLEQVGAVDEFFRGKAWFLDTDVTPARGDKITRESVVWDIVNVKHQKNKGIWELTIMTPTLIA